MIQMLTQFGAEGGDGIGALGISGSALVIQLITFVIAFLVLRRFAFKPILKVLRERRELIESGVELGEKMKMEQAAFDRKLAENLQKARAEADGIVAGANDTAKTTVREAEEKARERAGGIVRDAELQAEQATKRAYKKLEGEIVGLVSDATETIIGEKVDAKKDALLIDKALAEQKV